MFASIEGEILRHRESDPRGQHPLNDWIICEVQEECEIACRSARFEPVTYEVGVAVGQPHRDDDHLERLADDVRLRGDLDRQLEVRQPSTGEHRQLLSAHKRCQGIDAGQSREDRVARNVADSRVQRRTLHRAVQFGEHWRSAVEGLAHAVPNAPKPLVAEGNLQRATFEGDRDGRRFDPCRALKDFDDGCVPMDLEHDSLADLARGETDSTELVESDTFDPLDDEQRTFRLTSAAVGKGNRGHSWHLARHARASRVASASSTRAVTPATSSGFTSSRTRATPERSACSIAAAGTPRPTSATHRS